MVALFAEVSSLMLAKVNQSDQALQRSLVQARHLLTQLQKACGRVERCHYQLQQAKDELQQTILKGRQC